MGKEDSSGKVVITIKVTIFKTKGMGTVRCSGMMAPRTKGNGS